MLRRLAVVTVSLICVVVLAVVAAPNGPVSQARGQATGAGSASLSTVALLMGASPGSLDPGVSYTVQAMEPDWLAYTGLVTYAHAGGSAGERLIPGLATSLPKVTDGGKTYTVTLRPGLVYSNGAPVRASDFTWTLERAIKLWEVSGTFLKPVVQGAAAYGSGSARTVSGVVANNATRQITIRLTAPVGWFEDVLAFPALGLVPTGTPMHNEPSAPPPGVGPYMLSSIKPNRSFMLVRNSFWAQMSIPGIPAGSVDVRVRIDPNVYANARAVLHNTADVFDWADQIPNRLLPRIRARAGGRYSQKVGLSSDFIFLNTREKPFSSQLAREAVVTALDENAMHRIASGRIVRGCHFLPPGMVGHTTGPCPYGSPIAGGNLAKGRALIKRSGMGGTRVTVWTEDVAPRLQWMDYYARLLRRLGFRVRQRFLPEDEYFNAIGNRSNQAQTGFDDWNADFPDPTDFYTLLNASVPYYNASHVDDPRIQHALETLTPVLPNSRKSVASRWRALDRYVARKAYFAVFGHQTFPLFTSNRIDHPSAVFQPEYGLDWSSLQLK
jgi:peptide/nickel transport system substrate-binding protein